MPQRRPLRRLARDRPTGYLWLYRAPASAEQPHPTGPRMKRREITAVGDLNGDGYPDLLAVKKYTGNLYFYPRQALMASAGCLAGSVLVAAGGSALLGTDPR